jgi:hypothetical protein
MYLNPTPLDWRERLTSGVVGIIVLAIIGVLSHFS